MNLKSPDFLCNVKQLPDRRSSEYDAFWENETHKIKYGLTVDGVFISPWLYWHTQFWNIYQDKEDPVNNRTIREIQQASFRDNEWIISDALTEAQVEKKGIMLFGSRRLGKSEFLASHIGHAATIYKGSENAITGGNWVDIDIIVSKVILGLDLLPDYYKNGRIAEAPRKEIELGTRNKINGNWIRKPWSKIIIRNFEDGNNTEAAAGITATTFVMDEVGKYPFAQCFAAAKPAFSSPFGWRCVPILTGTSGDIVASSDAERFFFHPDANNFITKYLPEEGNKKVSVFISGLRRMEGKYETTLAGFVKTEKGILVPKNSELHTIPFKNSDIKKAEAVIDAAREAAAKDPDATMLFKETMYYPKNTKELFLRDDGNNFPIEAINETIAYLEANPQLQGTPVRLYRGVDTKVKISYNTDKAALIDYPIKPEADKNGAVILYELPDDNIPAFFYISGADPYNQSGSRWSNSLGCCYIYKRMYDPISGTFQRRIVASYTARPTNGLKEFHETIEMLLELYNATCMPENEAGTFIQYFDHKNKMYLLADGYDFLKEIAPKSSIPASRAKGLPAIVKVQGYYKELVYQYLTEKIVVGVNSETGELIEKLGCWRIPDIGLLRELAAYNDEGNFDRYVAFGHVLAYEAWVDKIYPYIAPPSTIDAKNTTPPPPKIRSPFDLHTSSNPFGISSRGARNPFGVSTRK